MGVYKEDWPHWLGGTRRQWHAKKRRDARLAEKAIWELLSGSAFLPVVDGWPGTGVVLGQIRALRKGLQRKVWK